MSKPPTLHNNGKQIVITDEKISEYYSVLSFEFFGYKIRVDKFEFIIKSVISITDNKNNQIQHPIDTIDISEIIKSIFNEIIKYYPESIYQVTTL